MQAVALPPSVGLRLGHFGPEGHGPVWRPVAKPQLLPGPGKLEPSPI